MKECAICLEQLSEDRFLGDVCRRCAERYSEAGVYFCLE